MDNPADTSSPPTVWALLDENAGHRNQVLGVADALGWPYETRDLGYNYRAALPNALLGASFSGLNAESRAGMTPPWPALVIAAGRRTAPVARAIRRASGGTTRLVQLMDPGSGADDFALMAVPSHDDLQVPSRQVGNLLRTLGAPHRTTPEVLAEAKAHWQTAFEDLAEPRIAVFVGGGTRRRAFTEAMVDDLAKSLSTLKKETGGSLMVTTSRRSDHVADRLKAALGDAADHFYAWGDEGENPYPGYLAWADRIVVTGDSVSMLSEACAAGVPVQIFAPAELITPKHARFHRLLEDAGYAAPLGQPVADASQQALDVAGEIAAAIRRLFD